MMMMMMMMIHLNKIYIYIINNKINIINHINQYNIDLVGVG